MAFVAAARANWIIVRDSKDRDRRLFLQAKNNLADAPGLAFRIQGGVIEWEADPIFDDVDMASQQPKVSQLEIAEVFLERELQEGPVPSAKLIDKARTQGVSEKTLRRAKRSLKVQHRQEGENFYWFLEEESVGQKMIQLAN